MTPRSLLFRLLTVLSITTMTLSCTKGDAGPAGAAGPAGSTGATGVAADDNAIPAENFTLTTMILPAGCEGPSHLHTDAEEVFFILKGNKVRIFVEHQGQRHDVVLRERDCISVPPGVYRGLVNEGIEEALMCVMIGNPKPVTPSYPADHPVAKIKRPKK